MQEIWASKLTETIVAKVQNEGFKRGELTKLFQTLAVEFNEENPGKLSNYYYRVIKKEIEDLNPETKNNTNKTNKTISQEKKSLNLIYFDFYPAEKADIDSFKENIESSVEWICFSQCDRNIVGTGFKDYLKTIDNGKIIKMGIIDNKEIEVIEKETLKNNLSSFSAFTKHLNAAKEADALSYLLKCDNFKLNELKSIKRFERLKFGEIVGFKISKLMPYGVMGHLINYPQITGMVHISEVRNGYVEDVANYFYEEQEVEVKVLQKKENMKLALSTKGLKLPLLTEQNIVGIKEKYDDSLLENNKIEESLQVHANAIECEEVACTVEPDSVIETNFPNEWNSILEYVKSFVGPLSPDAKEILKNLIQEYGLFQFSIGINDATKDFKGDLGVILLSAAQKILNGGISKIQYKVSSHAVKSYIERTHKDISFDLAEIEILENLSKAEIIIETDNYRYLKHGVLYYPCGKVTENNKIVYIATTTLTRKMLEEGNFFDEALERYSNKAFASN